MNNLKVEVKRLTAQIEKLHETRSKIIEKLEKQEEPKYRKMIGKCFVYQNSYSNNETWPLYLKILDYKDNAFEVLVFQIMSDKTYQIEIKTHYRTLLENNDGYDGYNEISNDQFNINFTVMLDKMRDKGVEF